MAINLVARMVFKDEATPGMRRVKKGMEDMERANTRMARHIEKNNRQFGNMRGVLGRVSGAFGTFGRGVGFVAGGVMNLIQRLNPLHMALTGIAAGATAAYSAVKIFNATVGEAMKMQQSQIVIGAMFDDEALSKQYMALMDKIAIKSPLLDSQTMYGNSKSFITATKDLGQLEKMWSLAERLMASDPAQGLEGAIFALRELFSGDAISIVDRFELPRTIMNEIKKLPLEQQLTRLDEYFNKIGLTTKLIDDMGGSALGMWTQVKERWQLVLRDMGEPSLKAVSEFLGNLLDRLEGEDMQKFADWGGRVIENMVTGMSNSAIKIYDWITALSNDPEFQSRTTIWGKVDFVVQDIADKFMAWYNSEGEAKLIDFGSKAAQTMIAALDATDEVFALGGKLGGAIWDGILAGVKQSAKESPIGAFLQAGVMTSPKNIWNTIKTGARISRVISGGSYSGPLGNEGTRARQAGPRRSHSAGLERVPYDGYTPTLHQGERVLTAQQAREYNNSSGKATPTIIVQNMNVREENDIQKIAKELAILLTQAEGLVARP